MFQVWSERRILPDCVGLLSPLAEPIGPGVATPDDILSVFAQADGVLAGGMRYTAEVMDKAPNLLIISRMGIGYEAVDIPAATARGIAVSYTPDGPTISTAEHAVALIFAVAKDLKKAEHSLRRDRRPDHYGRHSALELFDSRLGLVGLGRIGSRVAAAMRSVGMKVSAFDPFAPPERAEELGVRLAPSLESLLAESDVVSLHLPLSADTRHLIDAQTLGQMKQGAILVNVSRGGLVDEAALLAALESGRLRGAGLDVTDPEPAPADHPLLQRNDVIVTPHVGSASAAGKRRILAGAIHHLMQAFRGERPDQLLNPEVWPRVLERLQARRMRT